MDLIGGDFEEGLLREIGRVKTLGLYLIDDLFPTEILPCFLLIWYSRKDS